MSAAGAAAQTAAAAAAFGAQRPIAAQLPVDPAALQAWAEEVEGRMNAQHTGLTGLGVQLDTTISQAKAAMEAIVAGVSQELTGFKRLVHHDHGKLNVMVGQLQQKFAEVDVTMQGPAAEMMAAVTRMDAHAGRAESRAGLA